MKMFSSILLRSRAGRALVLCLAALSAPLTHASDPSTLVVGLYRPTLTLNVALNPDYTTTLPGSQVFASLLRFDVKGAPEPYLAKSWLWSSDQRVLTLKIVENGIFHDGTPITSQDVKFSILAVKALTGATSKFAAISEIRTPDAHTVVVQLSHPSPAILLAMSSPFLPIMPEHVYGQGNIRTNPANTTQAVGSGPFKLTEFKAGQYVSLERFDKFFLGAPKLQRLIFKSGADVQTLVLGLERGEIDVIPYMYDWRLVKRLSAEPNFAVSSQGYVGIGPLNNITFNLRHKPIDDIRVRKAIAYAIDRPFIAKTLLGGGPAVAISPLALSTPFHIDDVEKYAPDLKKAAALLDEAGFKPGADGIRMKLTMLYPPGNVDYHKNGAEYARSQLRKVGIDVDVRATDFVGWLKATANGEFDMSMMPAFNFGDPTFGVAPRYASSNIIVAPYANNSGYSNKVVDDLLAAGSVEIDPIKRGRIYAQFQKIAMDEIPLLPLTELKFYTVSRKGVVDLPTGFWGTASPFNDVRWQSETAK